MTDFEFPTNDITVSDVDNGYLIDKLNGSMESYLWVEKDIVIQDVKDWR